MQKTILCISVTIVIISIFFALIPNKAMQSTMKFTLNLFLISTIIMPVLINIKKSDFSKYFNILEKNKLDIKDLEKKVSQTNEKNLKNALQIVFLQNGYKDLDISIDIDKENKKTEILIKIPENKNYNKEKIKTITEKQTGITPKIEYF